MQVYLKILKSWIIIYKVIILDEGYDFQIKFFNLFFDFALDSYNMNFDT